MGIRIKIKRIEKGIKQKDLAKAAKISQQYLGYIENGKAKNPSIEVMKKISEVLETTVQELFFD